MIRRAMVLGLLLTGCETGMGSNDNFASTDTSTGGDDTPSLTDTTPPSDTPTAPDTSTTPTGATLYAKNCSSCHGPDGRGSTLGPTLLFVTPGYAKHVVRTGRDEMSEFVIPMSPFDTTGLPDADLDLIIEYLWSGTRPTDGAEAFVTYCANCHGQDAKGGRVGEGIRAQASGEPGEYFEKVREGHGGTNYGARTSYMPSWTVAAIPDTTIQAIIDHVKSL